MDDRSSPATSREQIDAQGKIFQHLLHQVAKHASDVNLFPQNQALNVSELSVSRKQKMRAISIGNFATLPIEGQLETSDP
jgi:hypothetical protein